MLLFWRIRYLDTRDKQFKDRDLWLETDGLDNVKKAAVELAYELKDIRARREMLRYRHLFCEKKPVVDGANLRRDVSNVFIVDYFEDESGDELSNKRMAEVLTGSSNAIMFRAGVKQHTIDYTLSKKRPIPINRTLLSQGDLKVLGYFARDLREVVSSAFYKDGPGKLTSSGANAPSLSTAVTDDEIRSFITIFRRLYMKKEPASFVKAVEIFERATSGYPLTAWVKGVAGEYEAALVEEPHFVPFHGHGKFPFTRKRLIDVFLYTQYAHQPDAQRSRQFRECLSAVRNSWAVLTWLFLTELHTCTLHMRNAGIIIADFYDSYCQCHKVCPDVLGSVAKDNPGIGTLEKKEAREMRIFREKVEELAKTIWVDNGCPEGGHIQFCMEASEQLKAEVKGW